MLDLAVLKGEDINAVHFHLSAAFIRKFEIPLRTRAIVGNVGEPSRDYGAVGESRESFF